MANAAFDQYVADIKATLVGNQQAALEFECAQHDKSYTDQHGAILASFLHHWCSMTMDERLPPVHLLLLKTPKGHLYGVLGSLLAEY
jgi:hypothetical protein